MKKNRRMIRWAFMLLHKDEEEEEEDEQDEGENTEDDEEEEKRDVRYLHCGQCCWSDPSCGGGRPSLGKAVACKQDQGLLNIDPRTKSRASPNEQPASQQGTSPVR